MKLRDTSLPVVVLQMQHHGALGAVRSLGRLGVPMYGVHPTHRPVGSFSKYCRKVFALDLDGNPGEESVDSVGDARDDEDHERDSQAPLGDRKQEERQGRQPQERDEVGQSPGPS